MRFYITWLFNYLLNDSTKIDSRDLAVYGNAYSNPDAIRAGHAWYKAFPRDINDGKTYKKLEIPVLGLGAEFVGYKFLQVVESKATNFRLVKIENSGHFIQIEQPDVVSQLLIDFFKQVGRESSWTRSPFLFTGLDLLCESVRNREHG